MVLDNDGGDEQALYNTIVSFELNIKSREPMFFIGLILILFFRN
ncbi:hypothetical protein BANRA_01339 [Acinetobacter baumannii]|nr:hypothetical protein BANRA_01374 [Acinetobacter baumannii]VDA12865.1 hypothetical protein BANRA_01339 [Acinetobacter baumannii]